MISDKDFIAIYSKARLFDKNSLAEFISDIDIDPAYLYENSQADTDNHKS